MPRSLRNSVAITIVVGLCGLAQVPAALAAQRTHRSPQPQFVRVPALLELGPDCQPGTTVILAVGAVTTLDFGDETPLSFVSGLREQLGVQEGAANFPGNLIHLRPALELAGKITNVTVETNQGRISFFAKTIFDPHGAQPGTFHSEIRIRTAGHVARMKALNDRVASLEKELLDAKSTEVRNAAEMRKQVDGALTQGYQKGAKAVLDRLTTLPVGARNKRHELQKVNDLAITMVASTAGGANRLVLLDIENKGAITRKLDEISVQGGQIVMQPEAHDILPRQKVRVAALVSGSSQEMRFKAADRTASSTVAMSK